LIRNLLKIRS